MRALSDERIAPALRLMHREPGRAWQLGERQLDEVGYVVAPFHIGGRG
jgi:hypothetical protein